MDFEHSKPSSQSIRGLNSLIFFISDIRHGVGPLISIHLRNSLNWDPAKIGMALAAVEFTAFLSQIPAGLLIDASKFKKSIIGFACLLIIIGCLTLYFFSSFIPIIIAQLIMGIAISLISPALGGITLGLFGRKKFPSRLGKNEAWNHSGNVFSALLAGLISYYFGSKWIFFLFIGFAIGSLVSTSRIKSKEIDYAIARELPENGNSPLPFSNLFKRTPLIIFNISLILYYLANGAQMTLVVQILTLQDPLNSSLYIAGAMIIAELTMILVAFVLSSIVHKFDRKTLFLTAFMILPIRAILYTVIESPYLLLLLQIFDGTAAGILGIMGTLINSDLAVGTGRFNLIQGFGGMSTSIGETFSQILGGFIAFSFGFNFSFFFLAFTGIIGIFFFAILMPETKDAGRGCIRS